MSARTWWKRHIAADCPADLSNLDRLDGLDRGCDDWSDPGAHAITEAELLAIAVGCGLLHPIPACDAYEVTNLLPTPDDGVWFDPATGALVRIPRVALRAAKSEGLN